MLASMSAGVAALAQSASGQGKPPAGEIAVRVTAGDKRHAAGAPLKWQPARGSSANAIVLDPSQTFQEILGFGAAFTDSACYTFNRLAGEARERLFRELFDPAEMGLSVCRLCIGSSDYAAKMYSFDEGEPDPGMKRFSIDHDREYILPIVKQARAINPALFLFGSPWSPPGWMKSGGTMLGGAMRKSSFAPYALYFAKFLEGYAQAGVPVDAVTVQNEVDTEQEGRMPACIWGQEYETEFVSEHLGPQLAARKLPTKIWIIDHNYNLWGRAIAELDEPKVRQYVDGVAWHGYLGQPSAMTRVHEAHPDKSMHWTEGGPDIRDPRYQTDWAVWGTTFAGILRNWSRSIVGWNLALDEEGNPNIGPFKCGGVVTVHSKSGEITRSGQYWAFAHYSRAIHRGARRIDSAGELEGVSHVAFANPGGPTAVVVSNKGGARTALVHLAGMEAEVALPADSLVTLSW